MLRKQRACRYETQEREEEALRNAFLAANGGCPGWDREVEVKIGIREDDAPDEPTEADQGAVAAEDRADRYRERHSQVNLDLEVVGGRFGSREPTIAEAEARNGSPL
jgi:hypothetical protein